MADEADTRDSDARDEARVDKVAAVVITIVALAHVLYYFPRVVDDLFISLRFADNFAHARGIVFNPGERVEGYSSPLWMVLQAVGLLVGFEGVTWTKLLGIASLGAILIGVHRFARERLGVARLPALLPPLFLALDSHVVSWSVLGLETPAYLALLVWYPIVLGRYFDGGSNKRNRWIAGAVVIALACARPEAPLFVVALGVAEWTSGGEGARLPLLRGRLRPVLRLAGPVLAVLVGLLLLRRIYFGLWLPHTYYVKGASSGWELAKLGPLLREGAGALERGVYIGGVVLALALAVFQRRPTVLAAIACALFFTGSVERDWMPSLRHLLPVVVFTALAWAWGVDRIATMKMEFARTVAAVFAISVVVAGLQIAQIDSRLSPNDKRDRAWVLLKTKARASDTWLAMGRIEPAHIAAFGPFEMGLITQNYRLIEASAAPLAESWFVGRDIGMVGYYTDARVFDTAGLFTPVVVRSDPWRQRRQVDDALIRAAFANAPVSLELLDEWTAPAGAHPALLVPYDVVVGSRNDPVDLVQRDAPRPTPKEIVRRYEESLARFPRWFDLHTLYGESVGAAMRKRVRIAREWLEADERGAGAAPPALGAESGAGAILSGQLAALGCEMSPPSVRAGSETTVTCWWRVLARPTQAYGTFLHFVDGEQGKPALLGDRPSGGLRPTTSWVPGTVVRDEGRVAVPSGMPPGRYPLRFGMWSGDGRMSVTPSSMNDGSDRVPGAVLEVLPRD